VSDDKLDDFGDDDIIERLEGMTDEDAQQRAESLRRGLEDYDLDDDDIAVLESQIGDTDEAVSYTHLRAHETG
jgi:GTP-binding protein